eukprot:TRINITY_DN1105_c2_g1_i1.p1 TRINITY_DN1105_c2_g1~~TRINITY_DN1105_c2_g1_i1.p1  ORF type:complete len:1174 (+),score=108.95 TRINITY_DN1105_c2_g1_i1:100-3522(+)
MGLNRRRQKRRTDGKMTKMRVHKRQSLKTRRPLHLLLRRNALALTLSSLLLRAILLSRIHLNLMCCCMNLAGISFLTAITKKAPRKTHYGRLFTAWWGSLQAHEHRKAELPFQSEELRQTDYSQLYFRLCGCPIRPNEDLCTVKLESIKLQKAVIYMSALLEGKDQKYISLFSKGIVGIQQLLQKESFKGIHNEVKKIISILTGQPIEKKPESVPLPLPRTNVGVLLEGLEEEKTGSQMPSLAGLDLNEPTKKEDQKLFTNLTLKPTVPDTAVKPAVPDVTKQKEKPSAVPNSLLDFPLDQPMVQLPLERLEIEEVKKEESIFGNSGTMKATNSGTTVGINGNNNNNNKPMEKKFELKLDVGNKKEEDNLFDFVDEVLKQQYSRNYSIVCDANYGEMFKGCFTSLIVLCSLQYTIAYKQLLSILIVYHRIFWANTSQIITLLMTYRIQGTTFILREEVPGESAIFSGSIPAEFDKTYQALLEEGNTSAPAMIEKTAAKFPTAIAITEKTESGYKNITYEELISSSKNLAKALLDGEFCPEIDISGQPMRFFGAFMCNRSEFVYADLACYYLGGISISLFEEPYDHLIYIVNSASFDTVVLQPNYARLFIKLIKEGTLRHLKHFILTEELDSESQAEAKTLGIAIWSLSGLIERGKASSRALPHISPDTVGAFMVTSGSTGYPKAVMITHKSLIYLHLGQWSRYLHPGDSVLANLNYAFGTSKLSIMMCLSFGGKIIFYGNRPEKTLEVMRETNPTFVVFPPIFLHKVYASAMESINQLPEPQREGMLKAIDAKIQFIKARKELCHPELDKVLTPIRNKLFGTGLKTTFFIGSSIREDALWFFRAIMGCPLHNLYGLTESGNWCTMSQPWSPYDCIGSPLPGIEFKVVDWKEGGYSTKDVINGKPTPRGELYVRGGSVFAGYFKEPEKTKEAFEEGNWLRTRDIVKLNLEDMSLTIIDRVNNVTKISNEEFVAVELLEKIYEESKYVSQIYVHATPQSDFLIAVVALNGERILKWAKEKSLLEDLPKLCKHAEVIKMVLEDFKEIATKKQLNSYEYISKVILTHEPFTQENGLLTFSYKLRRGNLRQKYKEEIETLSKSGIAQQRKLLISIFCFDAIMTDDSYQLVCFMSGTVQCCLVYQD